MIRIAIAAVAAAHTFAWPTSVAVLPDGNVVYTDATRAYELAGKAKPIATGLKIGNKRATASKSETSVTVKSHPGYLLRSVRLGRRTASKEARMTYLAVHNVSRHVI